MLFGDVECAHKFYKTYAHDTRFSIRTGQQRCDENGVVKWKRFLCSREGYKTSIRSKSNESSTKVCKTRESRCGCEFMSNALMKASTKLQHYMRDITMNL
jgi:hypothetical protein